MQLLTLASRFVSWMAVAVAVQAQWVPGAVAAEWVQVPLMVL